MACFPLVLVSTYLLLNTIQLQNKFFYHHIQSAVSTYLVPKYLMLHLFRKHFQLAVNQLVWLRL